LCLEILDASAELIYLQIKSLSLSFSTAKNMIEIIEKNLPQGPRWKSDLITLCDAPAEPHEFYYRDILECVKFLFSDPSFSGDMLYRAAEHYQPGDHDMVVDDCEGLDRRYSEMNTGNFWVQEEVCDLATMTFAFTHYV
jgi:hypothetical protein